MLFVATAVAFGTLGALNALAHGWQFAAIADLGVTACGVIIYAVATNDDWED